jgi:hypothetical protein
VPKHRAFVLAIPFSREMPPSPQEELASAIIRLIWILAADRGSRPAVRRGMGSWWGLLLQGPAFSKAFIMLRSGCHMSHRMDSEWLVDSLMVLASCLLTFLYRLRPSCRCASGIAHAPHSCITVGFQFCNCRLRDVATIAHVGCMHCRIRE